MENYCLEEIIERWVRKLSYEELEFLKENYSLEEIEMELFDYFIGKNGIRREN